MNAPTVDEVDRISKLNDPIVRNLQITQCYYQISRSIAPITAVSANWCTFAIWASKQAGQTIRKEDLVRAFEEGFFVSPEISGILEDLIGLLRAVDMRLEAPERREILQALNPAAAVDLAADAVARGNRKVFQEIGREF